MHAELRGRLNPDCSSDVSRREDVLTDCVFSAIRYLPRDTVLAGLLALITPDRTWMSTDLDAAKLRFWPNLGGVEPDFLIEIADHVIVFEAKLRSPFQRHSATAGPTHQLTAQWRAATRCYLADKVTVVEVAITADVSEPTDIAEARGQLIELEEPERSRAIQWLSWYHLAEIFRVTTDLRMHERAVRDDVLEVMHTREVDQMFQGFDASDYAAVSEAHTRAAQRLYPVMSLLIETLCGDLAMSSIKWASKDSALLSGTRSYSRKKPQQWLWPIIAPFWPDAWPKKQPKSVHDAVLYVWFDFADPAIEVGYTQSAPGKRKYEAAWRQHHAALATELVAAPADGFAITVSGADWNDPAPAVPAGEVSQAWLNAQSNVDRIRLRRRLSIADVITTDPVCHAVLATVGVVEACPTLFAMLRESAQLQPV